MKICYIIVIIFCCDLSRSEKSNAIQEEHSIFQTSDEQFRDNTKENIEINTSEILRQNNLARNCLDLKKQNKKSGTYFITPCDCPNKLVKVYCDMDTDGGGWTVIQRRDDYSQQENFFKNWYEYAIGFGDVSKDFWLGNDNIHCLTQQSHQEIRFDLEDFDGNSRYAKYGFFQIDDRINLYKLSVRDYSGNAGDSFSIHNDYKFSTYDADNDTWSSNCAERFKGAWWHGACYDSNLNGMYLYGKHSSYGDGVEWEHWKGIYYSLKKSEMKIREKM